MSEIFEGVLAYSDPGELQRALQPVNPGVPLAIEVLRSGMSVAYRTDPRETATFSAELDRVARELSRALGEALVVRYDSRVGQRSAALYENGAAGRSFGEADELYVRLDEQGYPLQDAAKLRLDQLSPDEEYETARNAIQLGLDALGHGGWEDLHELMTR